MDMIKDECLRHDLDHLFLPTCINLKAQYARMQKLNKEVGLVKALEFLDIDFEGSHHRALDDAYNTTKLFLRLLDRWQY
jgi:3'-5' exoribonuclease 1